MAAVRDRQGVVLTELNLGGGHAVPCIEGDEAFDLAGFAGRAWRVIATECASRGQRLAFRDAFAFGWTASTGQLALCMT